MKARHLTYLVLNLVPLLLAGCGITYTSPSVREQTEGLNVRTVELTAQNVLVANQMSSYTPKELPNAFYSTAGGGNLRDLGRLPAEPYVPATRRKPLTLNAPPVATPPRYTIGVGDVVILATKSSGSTVEELTGLLAAQNQREGYTVRDDGMISIPDIGQVELVGLTLQDAEASVFNALVDRGLDPAFSLEVSEFNSKRVAVGGSVGNPTLVPITLNTLNLSEAITVAGGIQLRDKEFASIRIYRTGDLYQIPLETYLANRELQRIPLLDGDAVYVDTTYDLDRALEFYRQRIDVIALQRGARGEALSELESEIGLRRDSLDEQREVFSVREGLGAEDRDYIYVTGEFRKHSRFEMPYSQHVSLADVLYDGGGYVTTTADASQIYVIRTSQDPATFGAVTAWHLNAKNAAAIALATRLEMRPNDIVFIAEQPITTWARALGQFFPVVTNLTAESVL
ncbi:MAG: polysaccharide biosynthesis/export family protein [Rhodobacteraceae bacterium]|nr:polysaccharide biosynthesis/export family protein [Paracoccaceae bacterium]